MIHVHCRHVLWNHRNLPMYRRPRDILSTHNPVHGIQNHICNLGSVRRPRHYRIEHRYFWCLRSWHNLCPSWGWQKVWRLFHRLRCEKNHQHVEQGIGKYRGHCNRLGKEYVGKQIRYILLHKYIHHWNGHIYHVLHTPLHWRRDHCWRKQRQPRHRLWGTCLKKEEHNNKKKEKRNGEILCC